jgi:hypothetical protein
MNAIETVPGPFIRIARPAFFVLMSLQARTTVIFLPFIMGRSGVYHLDFDGRRVEAQASLELSGPVSRARLHWKGWPSRSAEHPLRTNF